MSGGSILSSAGGLYGKYLVGAYTGVAGLVAQKPVTNAVQNALHPSAPALAATPNVATPANSADSIAAAREKARDGQGASSAADILTGGAGLTPGSQRTSSNVLLGS